MAMGAAGRVRNEMRVGGARRIDPSPGPTPKGEGLFAEFIERTSVRPYAWGEAIWPRSQAELGNEN